MNTIHLVIIKKSMIPPENMLFEIGSITKVFTSILLLEMEREKLLSSDDMVGKFVQNVENDYLNKITLKSLATHTSGLPILATNHILAKRSNPYSMYTEEDLTAFYLMLTTRIALVLLDIQYRCGLTGIYSM